MGAQWLLDSVRTIAAATAVVAVAECAVSDSASDSNLRLVCGAVAASSILQLLSACIQRLF